MACGGLTDNAISRNADASISGAVEAGPVEAGPSDASDVEEGSICGASDQAADDAKCPPDCFVNLAASCPLLVDYSVPGVVTSECVGQSLQSQENVYAEYQCFSNGVVRELDFPSQRIWNSDGSLCWTATHAQACQRMLFFDGNGLPRGTLEPISVEGYFTCPDGSRSRMTLSCWHAIMAPLHCQTQGTCSSPDHTDGGT